MCNCWRGSSPSAVRCSRRPSPPRSPTARPRSMTRQSRSLRSLLIRRRRARTGPVPKKAPERRVSGDARRGRSGPLCVPAAYCARLRNRRTLRAALASRRALDERRVREKIAHPTSFVSITIPRAASAGVSELEVHAPALVVVLGVHAPTLGRQRHQLDLGGEFVQRGLH